MGIEDTAKDAVGQAKEAIGDAMNNPSLERQGEVDQDTATVDKVKHGVQDKIDDARDAIKDKL